VSTTTGPSNFDGQASASDPNGSAKPLNLRDLYVRASNLCNSLTDEIRRYLDVDEMHLPATSRGCRKSDGLSDELAAYPKAPAAIFGVNTSNSEASFEHVCDLTPRGGSGMVDANACRTHEWHSRNLSPPNGSRPIMRCFKESRCLALPHLRRASKSMLFADQLACPGSHNDKSRLIAPFRSRSPTTAIKVSSEQRARLFSSGWVLVPRPDPCRARPPSLSNPVEK